MMRAAQSLTRTALRLATTDKPTTVLQALAKYQQAGLPEPELAAEVGEIIEATMSPDWRANIGKVRQRRAREQMERDCAHAEQAIADLPSEMVLRVARERSDILGAAVDAIERRADGNGEILHQLKKYMNGTLGIDAVRWALEKAGIEPGHSNIVRLPVRTAQR